MPRDSYSAPTGLPVVDRNARFRVHRWLSQPDSAARQPAVDCVAVLKPAGAEVVDSPAAVPALTARQKVAILWRKWKSRVSSKPEKNASSRPLSAAVLKRHQQQCDLQSVSSMCYAADTKATNASGAAAGSLPLLTLQRAADAGQALPVVELSATPGASKLPAAQRNLLDAVYDSPFYQPSSSSQSPQTLKPGVTASVALPPIPKSSSTSLLPLKYTTSYSSTAVPKGGETPSPSVTPRGVSVLRGSSGSFNQTHSNDPSQHGQLSGPRDSREFDHVHAIPREQLQQSSVACTAATDTVLPAQTASLVSPTTPVRPVQMQQLQRPPMQHSPDVFASAHNTQLQQLLQAPKQQQPGLQQLRPVETAASPLLLAGSALTAYPGVAALSMAASGSLLQACSTAAVQQGFSGVVHGPHAPTAAAVAELEASTNPQAVQQWLLRTALLEDELQGRALEVAEELQVQHERRELFASLASALQQSPAGSAEHEAAVQEAADSLGLSWGVGSTGALYRARSGTRGGRPGIRIQVNAELTRLDGIIAKLQARASGLGSALATLQGCQAVLGGSKASRLSSGSRLAVLQLVLSDVAARLPDEQLQELEVLDGLPSLDPEAREICALAGAGSIQAALLQAGVGPAQVKTAIVSAAHSPRVSAVPAAGLQLPDMQSSGGAREGSVVSAASLSTATTNSRFKGSRYSTPLPAPPPPSNSSQQNAPWYADLRQHDDDDDSDDDIMDSLSSVLSSRHYTPRVSLCYESRKAAAAAALQAAARHPAASARRYPAGAATPTVASGSAAAAAGAAALTLAGIAGSGSWVQLPQEVDDGFGSGQHAAMWDVMRVQSPGPGSVNSSQRHSWRQPPQPLSPSSAASSRRGSSRAGFGYGPSGLPFPLPSCPESPTTAAGQGPGLYSAGPALRGIPAGLANLSARMHSIEQQLLQSRGQVEAAPFSPQQLEAVEAGRSGLEAVPVPSETPELVVRSQPVPVPAPAKAPPVEHQQGCSRSSSFESCVSARSRFSMDVQQTASAGPVVLTEVNNGPANTRADQIGVPMEAGRHMFAAAGNGSQGLNSAQLLSSALPAGVDVHNMTVGELLRVLTTAVTQQQQSVSKPGDPLNFSA